MFERIKRLIITLTGTAEGSFDAIMSHRHCGQSTTLTLYYTMF